MIFFIHFHPFCSLFVSQPSQTLVNIENLHFVLELIPSSENIPQKVPRREIIWVLSVFTRIVCACAHVFV